MLTSRETYLQVGSPAYMSCVAYATYTVLAKTNGFLYTHTYTHHTVQPIVT